MPRSKPKGDWQGDSLAIPRVSLAQGWKNGANTAATSTVLFASTRWQAASRHRAESQIRVRACMSVLAAYLETPAMAMLAAAAPEGTPVTNVLNAFALQWALAQAEAAQPQGL